MTAADAQAFVERLQQLWQDPEPEGYADLWHQDRILRHPTMKQALPQDQIPDYVRRLKTVAPDVSLAVNCWQPAETPC